MARKLMVPGFRGCIDIRSHCVAAGLGSMITSRIKTHVKCHHDLSGSIGHDVKLLVLVEQILRGQKEIRKAEEKLYREIQAAFCFRDHRGLFPRPPPTPSRSSSTNTHNSGMLAADNVDSRSPHSMKHPKKGKIAGCLRNCSLEASISVILLQINRL